MKITKSCRFCKVSIKVLGVKHKVKQSTYFKVIVNKTTGKVVKTTNTMKTTFLLMEDGKILDKVDTYSTEDAILIFKRDRDWIFSDRTEVISEEDLKNECELNSLENQTYEG